MTDKMGNRLRDEDPTVAGAALTTCITLLEVSGFARCSGILARFAEGRVSRVEQSCGEGQATRAVGAAVAN